MTSYSSMPLGFRFKPTHEELLRHYLLKKVHGQELPYDGVVELDVYAHEPWLLTWDESRGMSYEDRYYFTRRERMSRNGNGKRPRKTLQGVFDGGWWKANTGDKDIADDQGTVLGHMKTLTFFTYKNMERKRKEATKSDWIMYEYRLSSDEFQEWVLCRIKYGGKRRNPEDMKIPEDSDPVVEGSTENTKENDINRADNLQNMQLAVDDERFKMSKNECHELLLLEEMLMSENKSQLAEDILLTPDEIQKWLFYNEKVKQGSKKI